MSNVPNIEKAIREYTDPWGGVQQLEIKGLQKKNLQKRLGGKRKLSETEEVIECPEDDETDGHEIGCPFELQPPDPIKI